MVKSGVKGGRHVFDARLVTSAPSCFGGRPLGQTQRLMSEQAPQDEVQNALEDAEGDWEREALVAELRGHAAEAARCPHANHVLQKALRASCAPRTA